LPTLPPPCARLRSEYTVKHGNERDRNARARDLPRPLRDGTGPRGTCTRPERPRRNARPNVTEDCPSGPGNGRTGFGRAGRSTDPSSLTLAAIYTAIVCVPPVVALPRSPAIRSYLRSTEKRFDATASGGSLRAAVVHGSF